LETQRTAPTAAPAQEPDRNVRLGSLLAEASPDALIATTPDATIVYWNQAAESIFGYSRAEAVGASKFDLIVPPDRIGEARRLLADTLRIGSASGETVRRRKDGSDVHLDVSAKVAHDPDGTGELIVVSHKDVTAIRSLHEAAQAALEEKTRALEAAREELARNERLAILGQLAGGVSHELRNPLGVIKNAVYYLNMVLPDDAKARKHLGIVEREIAAADRIVTGLLDFARVTPANRMAMNVNDTVREYLASKPPPANVTPVVTLAADLPAVHADAGQIELVLGNLVTNAVQAMANGGTLTVETMVVGEAVCITVADTGVGISEVHLAKIFEPLFTTKAKGIGLGLSVARRLAVANGATMTAESALGRGSVFTIRFTEPA